MKEAKPALRVGRPGRREDEHGGPRASADVLRLLHELEVHQIELRAQNEELTRSRAVAESALERYTTLFDFAPIGFATLGAGAAIVEVNHVGAELLGRERWRLRGASFATFIAVGDRPAFEAILDRTRASETRQALECTLLAPSGAGARHVRLTATVLAHDHGDVLLAFADITEQRAREEKLAGVEAMLREANARKDEFLAILSHELRNPLAPIRSGVSVLMSASCTEERAEGALKVIDRQVTHLTRLVDDLLDVTRIVHGKIELRREVVDFAALVRRTIEDHRATYEASGLALDVRVGPDQAWVHADPARLVQAVSNLLGNAEKFTPRTGRVEVSLDRRDGAVVLRVRDTGAGIPPELLHRVFEPFAQAPQTIDRSRGGLGLGLAMVKGILELHGGTVCVASPGRERGTTVTTSLPLTAPPTEPRPTPAPAPSGSRRILLIEDNEDAASVLRDELALAGNDVEAVGDGATALALALSFAPEIVLCDLGLPSMDGYQVARAFRREPTLKDVYLVALSGYARPEDVERALEAGFNRHVAKPIGLDVLEALVATAPGSSRPPPAGP